MTSSTLFACFGTILALVAGALVFIFIIVPIIGHVFGFLARLIRFIFQEIRDIILVPVALFVCAIKLIRAAICVVLARWDIVHAETKAAKARIAEAWDRTVAIFIDNPLRVFAIEPPKQHKSPVQFKHVQVELNEAKQALETVRSSIVESKVRFEGYKILGTLPAGGSGAKLFIAQPDNAEQKVVIKYFDISSGSQLPQIVRESRAMESAKKLGLVLEHRLDTNRFWYATPYHEGEHLGVVTNTLHGTHKNLTNKQFKSILLYQQTLLQTLRKYHDAGLWHKDVKPDNIIIHDETAHLVDLGLVTPLASAMTLTTHGTEYFRDPELVRQAMRGVKVHQVDGSKFDVYGAGAVLYFMLENTFPAHGCLSDFSKQSPEGLRWIVRRAMADYDKRYDSIEEMLGDVEAVLRSSHISKVRPADLPSVNESDVELDTVHVNARRLPSRTTPSTGGGPFPKRTYRTETSGIIAIIISIIVGVFVIFDFTDDPAIPTIETQRASILDYPQPGGRILILNDLGVSSNDEVRRMATNTIAQLDVVGWDVFIDPDVEARVRSWLPSDLQSVEDMTKLGNEKISGVLVLQQGNNGEIELTLIDKEGAHVFDVVQYVDG